MSAGEGVAGAPLYQELGLQEIPLVLYLVGAYLLLGLGAWLYLSLHFRGSGTGCIGTSTLLGSLLKAVTCAVVWPAAAGLAFLASKVNQRYRPHRFWYRGNVINNTKEKNE